MKKIAGVVILYNPSIIVIDNIKTYVNDLDVLYVVLNSKINNNSIYRYIKNEEKIHVIKHNENEGIAKSLNEVLKLVENKYIWLLTMDQDSAFASDTVYDYLSIVNDVDESIVYGITSKITCNQIIKSSDKYDYIDRCITSGMIVNVNIAIESGGFCEDLFIDEVDYEFCYRVNDKGYGLVRYPHKIMQHFIGNEKTYSILGYKFASDNESYFRLYYIYRNCLYVMREYPHTRKKYMWALLKRTIKIIIAEDDKMRKIKYILKGIKAFFFNKMGKLQE